MAGGQSSRMGQDKALLPMQGQPLIAKVYGVAACCCDRVMVISPWPERYQNLLPSDCRYVVERPLTMQATSGHSPSRGLGVSHGPLVGFYQGLGAVATEWVLLLACDLPQLQPQPLQAWAEHLGDLPTSTVAYLARQPQGWEPLCGFYRSTCRKSLGEFIAAGGRSFQRWLRSQQIAELPPSPQGASLFYNCNTPQDWQQLQDERRNAIDSVPD